MISTYLAFIKLSKISLDSGYLCLMSKFRKITRKKGCITVTLRMILRT